jgi:hypothetical protein
VNFGQVNDLENFRTAPPTTHCTPEMANPNAGKAAEYGNVIQSLRPAGGAAAVLAMPPAAKQDGDLTQCKTITDNAARLDCFDRLAGSKQ